MASGLTVDSFNKFLERLDADRDRAGEKFEELRRILLRFFQWRGAPFPEEQADETLTRVARRLSESVDIKHVESYCYEVARLVFLESLTSPDAKRASLDEINQGSDPRANEVAGEKEARLACLDKCLASLEPEQRVLIVEYYTDEHRSRIDRRRALAERLGLQREALANRAQRLRDKLERCVLMCLHSSRY
jgi:DNA-directed RNA polymerase specialized sigma24 family protein